MDDIEKKTSKSKREREERKKREKEREEEERERERSPLKSLSEKMSEANISITISPPKTLQTSPTTSTEKSLLRPHVLRLPQAFTSPEKSPKQKLEKENSPTPLLEKSGRSPSKKLKMEDRPLDPEQSSPPKKLKIGDKSLTPEESSPSKKLKVEDRPLDLEQSSPSKKLKMEDRPLDPKRDLIFQREKKNHDLTYGLMTVKDFTRLKNMWFDYSMPDDIKDYYEYMKTDSEEKTKDCERCNKNMYEKLVKLYKLGLQKDIPVQGYMRRDITSCPLLYRLQSSCDCLVACEKCDVLFCNERDYEGNTAPDLVEDPFLHWQGVVDRASSSKDLPELLNPDGSIYEENEEELEEYKKIKRYMAREMYREQKILHEHRIKEIQYDTELEKIVKENLIEYRSNRNKWPCRYGHITCKYSSDRNRVLHRSTPRYVRKHENPNFSHKLEGTWEPY